MPVDQLPVDAVTHTGGANIATELIGGNVYGLTKIRTGAYGVDGGDVTPTNPYPVGLYNIDTAPATVNITAADVASSTASGQNGQNIVTGNPTANSAASFAIAGLSSIEVQITGAWSATLVSEVSFDGGTTWYNRGVHLAGTAFIITSFTSNGAGGLNCAGATNYRIRCTAFTSGIATIRIAGSVNDSTVYIANAIKVADPTTPSQQMAVDSLGRVTANLGTVAGLALDSTVAKDASITTTNTNIGATTETVASTDTSASGLNGLLKRLLQRITTLLSLIPAALTGSGNFKVSLQESAASQNVTQATGTNLHAVIDSGTVTANAGTNLNTSALALDSTVAKDATLSTTNTEIGPTNETPAATDNSSGGLNAQIKRLAARLTSLIGLFPTSLGQKSSANSLGVTIASDQSAIPITDPIDITPATVNITAADAVSATNAQANGQNYITGNPTANSAAAFALTGESAVIVQVTGTWVGTLKTEISMDGGTTWFERNIHQAGTEYFQKSFTNNFAGGANVSGYTNFRVRCTAYTSGTATVKVTETVRQNSMFVTNAMRISDPTTASQMMAVDSLGRVTANLGTVAGLALDSTVAKDATIGTTNTEIGGLTETAPSNDTNSSGLNGRMQRMAQRITSLIGLFPTAIGQTTKALSLAVAIATDQVKSNNAGAPGTQNLGTLPALANASAPSWTEANQVTLSVDLLGNLRVSSSSTPITDVNTTGNLGSNGQTVTTATLNGAATASIQLLGTWTLTVAFEWSPDAGTTWYPLTVYPQAGGAGITSVAGVGTSGNGLWVANIASGSQVRTRVSTYTSGTVAVVIRTSTATGMVVLSAAIPAGSNLIGGINNNFAGTAADVNAGVKGPGTQRIVLANDQQNIGTVGALPPITSRPSAQSLAATGAIQFGVLPGATVVATLTNAPAATATWVGTVGFQTSPDGASWSNVNAIPNGIVGAGAVTATSSTAVGEWLIQIPTNHYFFRYNVTAWTSGTIWGFLDAWNLGSVLQQPWSPTVTSGQTLMPWTDASGIAELMIRLSAITTCVFTVQGTNDPAGTDVSTLQVQEANTAASTGASTITAAGSFRAQTMGFKWVRVQCTTTGTVATVQGITARLGFPLLLTSTGDSITALSSQSGTWTMQPGNTPNTTAWRMAADANAASTGGATAVKFLAAATTNAAFAKAGAGRVYGWHFTNNTAAVKFFRIFNKTSAPTVGTDSPVIVIEIPANGYASFWTNTGIAMTTGVAYACTGAIADLDATATAANDVVGALYYQ